MSSSTYVTADKKLVNPTISMDFGESFGGGLLGIACFVLVVFAIISVTGYVIQYAWNMTLPEIFGIKEITLYQAIGLYVLASILFKR